MTALRIALAQIDTTVGDLEGNAALVEAWTARAVGAGAHLVAFPEMTLTGYPAEDLVLRASFVEACAATLRSLAARVDPSIAVLVGHVTRDGAVLRNALSVLFGGSVVATTHKHHLPTYGVFDERRWFTPSERFTVLRHQGVDVGLTICEDLWQAGGPIAAAAECGVGLVLCVNGSPYEEGKTDERLELIARRAREAGAPLAYLNLVGAQDELVFDGGSFVVDASGTLVARAPMFVEDLCVVDVETSGTGTPPASAAGLSIDLVDLRTAELPAWDLVEPTIAERPDHHAEIWAALVLGLRDYVDKNRFPSVALGLSGGIDSAVVATIAVDALGADRVHTVGLPSAYSSQGSLDDAAALAALQGTHHRVIVIKDMVDAFQAQLGLRGLAEENLQARVRGTTLMALSNAEGHLILTTGNKSELATGFSTLYGDSAGGFAPIKDVPKTLVWELARWRNSLGLVIPLESIEKPPSAELAPGQLDSDRLPDYTVLDAVIDGYVEGDLGRAELIAQGHAPEVVDRVIWLVDVSEHKRRQGAPGTKISPKAFGRDRRLPITNRWREH